MNRTLEVVFCHADFHIFIVGIPHHRDALPTDHFSALRGSFH